MYNLVKKRKIKRKNQMGVVQIYERFNTAIKIAILIQIVMNDLRSDLQFHMVLFCNNYTIINKLINLTKSKAMKKMKKFLKFVNIKLELDTQHPKDISRVHFKLIESDEHSQITQQKPKKIRQQTQSGQTNGIATRVHKSKQYGNVTPTTISWQQEIQMPYESQECLKFQTVCQHQYGYEIQQLKALYSGSIYLKPEQFFRQLTAHVFNQQGIKCGIFRYMVKVSERQVIHNKVEKQQVAQQEVKVQLAGKVTLYGATLKNPALAFNPKKHIFGLRIAFGDQIIKGGVNKQNKWVFPGKKIQILENSPQYIHFVLEHDGSTFLAGVLQIQQIQRNKRFISQQLQMYDVKNQRMATLELDIRYLNKKQLLDLLYSPKQLAENHMEKSTLSSRPHRSKPELSSLWRKKNQFHQKTNTLLPVTMSNNPQHATSLSPQKIQKHLQAERLRKMLNRSSLGGGQSLQKGNGRYKRIYLMNNHHEIKMSQSKRFVVKPLQNPTLSYIQPDKLSPFALKQYGKKGHMIPHSNRHDPIRAFKNNPGVGNYHLPSIWEKY